MVWGGKRARPSRRPGSREARIPGSREAGKPRSRSQILDFKGRGEISKGYPNVTAWGRGFKVFEGAGRAAGGSDTTPESPRSAHVLRHTPRQCAPHPPKYFHDLGGKRARPGSREARTPGSRDPRIPGSREAGKPGCPKPGSRIQTLASLGSGQDPAARIPGSREAGSREVGSPDARMPGSREAEARSWISRGGERFQRDT